MILFSKQDKSEASAEPGFDDAGNVSSWRPHGRDWLETAPVRQNAPVDFCGAVVWVKSAPAERSGGALLSFVDWEFETRIVESGAGWREFERSAAAWTARLRWSWTDGVLCLRADLENRAGPRWRQFELSWWLPSERAGRVSGRMDGRTWNYRRTDYGRVNVAMLARGSALRFSGDDGGGLVLDAVQPDSRPHVYHRGVSLKLGSASTPAAPGRSTELELAVTATEGGPRNAGRRGRKEAVPELRGQREGYEAGLMLNLQYTGLANVPELLRRWFPVAARLGFDFVMVELDRGLAVHPGTPPWALSGTALRDLAAAARSEGLDFAPMFNLLGHQWETGILDWRPGWRETVFSGLCPSHPEVRRFGRELVNRLAEACASGWVHVGGDELKFPGDGRDGLVCPRCGPSPDLRRIVEYWNVLQEGTGVSLAVWGDQLLPPSAVAAGLQAHNWDDSGAACLAMLDRRIRIFDWQYGTVPPDSSVRFLSAQGHEVALAGACEYGLENPFVHARAGRAGISRTLLHTVWSSPDPRDTPLEGVAAAALAHSGEVFHPSRTPARCARLARGLFDVLDAG